MTWAKWRREVMPAAVGVFGGHTLTNAVVQCGWVRGIVAFAILAAFAAGMGVFWAWWSSDDA